MAQMKLFTEKKLMDLENRLVVAKGEKERMGWTRSLGLIDAKEGSDGKNLPLGMSSSRHILGTPVLGTYVGEMKTLGWLKKYCD